MVESKQLLICGGWKGSQADIADWSVQENMNSLGHWLSSNSSYQKCFSETVAAMLRAFHANVNHGLQHASEIAKQRFLSGSVLAIAKARLARWPYMSSTAGSLNTLQRKMISTLYGIRPRPEEPYEYFCIRRRAEASTIARRHGLWNREWARSITSWHQHVLREHDAETWSKPLLAWRGPEWLNLQRWLFGDSRTRSRVSRGKPSRRWLDGAAQAAVVAAAPP